MRGRGYRGHELERLRMTHPHQWWVVTVLVIAVFPQIYNVLACFAGWSFARHQADPSLNGFAPPVSVLKPLHGVDFASYENYESFCRQDYPEYEILFAVNDESDEAIPVVRRLMVAFPERRIVLLVGNEYFGANRKVNSLARLAREARHEILALSDGDVRVGSQYLKNVVSPLRDETVGAVTSFYRGIAANNIFARLESVGATAGFFPGVLMAAWTEGVKFALGASIATTKTWLRKIGGFESIAPYLADDYEVGQRVAAAGGRVVLSHEMVWTMYPAQRPRGFWQHQLRWARTVRLCRPASYAALLFTQGLPWTILAAGVAPNAGLAFTYVLAYLVTRFAVAWVVGVHVIGDETLRRQLWLLPVWDAVHFIVWLTSFASSRVVWGDLEYTVDHGRMRLASSRKSSKHEQTA
jgi:ceramide glucosyltransferase